MNTFKRSVFLLLGGLFIVACSTQKDRFINRNYHAVTAEYNILYNGNVAFDQGREELRAGYKDNYWEILPVERMQVSEEVMLPGQSKNQNFQTAEEKAAKAIQKHSMYIDGTEVNPQMDEAFLLLGKARYYDQRFIPALEAFNYILYKYPLSDNIDHAKVWREKTNIRLDNNELAIRNLKDILNESNTLKEQDIADASAMLAQAYINIEEIDSAIAPIATAAKLTKNNEQKGRYLFIKGQLYDRLGKTDSANVAFDEVIALNRKSPRIYMLNAHVEKIKNFDFEKGDKNALLEHLVELRDNRENRPFLDIIHHQLGEFYRIQDSTSRAIEYYNNSLRTNSTNKYLHAQNYVTIGNLYFDNKKYKLASNYFDSTLTKLAENTREYRAIKRKRDNLEDVVLYEEIVSRNDSILRIAKLSEEEQLAYFQDYTNRLKEQDEEAKEKERKGEGQQENMNTSVPGTTGARASSFYFYNNSTVSYGKLEFQRIWGKLELTDNWRLNPQEANRTRGGEAIAEEGAEVPAEENPQYHPGTYLAEIPKDPEVLDSIQKELNFANYQLGIIYKEKFSELGLAASRFEFLLQNNPEERLILPSKYNLYKIYSEMGNISEAEKMKQDILQNYPDSRYAAIIENPESLLQEQNNPESIYASLYRELEKEEYQKVIDSSEIYIEEFTGLDIVPKFELLKATAIGRLYGYEAYKEAINFVALTYPQSEEGKKAQELYNTAIPSLAYKNFGDDKNATDFKLVFPFSKTERESAVELERTLKDAIAELGVEGLKTSIDIYNPEQIFVVVHNLQSALGAEGLVEMINKHKKYEVDKEHYPISNDNYKIVQIHKNFEKYITSK